MTLRTKGQARRDKVDSALDEALEQTFPASDPLAMTEPSTANPTAAKSPKRRPVGKRADMAPGSK